VILAVGSDRLGEDGHRGGRTFDLLMHLLKLRGGFVAVLAKLAAEGRLHRLHLLDGQGGAALLFDFCEILA